MSAFTSDDHRHMSHALRLAARGVLTTRPNPRVGCVIVKHGRIVGEGWHERAGEPHAEVLALRQAGADAAGATVYVTLEPCSHVGRTPPCARALIEAGVGRVIAAMQDPNPQVAGQGLAALGAAGIDVAAGLLEAEARALNAGFVSRMTRGRPYVRIKLAASLDGRTAMASGESKWITSAAARRDVHRLRAESGAIVTGIGTVRADDPQLTVRDFERPPAWPGQPLRVVLDSHLATPPTAALLRQPGGTLIAHREADPARAEALRAAGAELLPLRGDDGRLHLPALLEVLAQREINDVLIESGPTLAGAFVQAGLADELIIYLAPHLMGHEGNPLFALSGMAAMADRVNLRVDELRQVGPDLRIRARIER